MYNLMKKNTASCFVSKSFSFLNACTLFFFMIFPYSKVQSRKKCFSAAEQQNTRVLSSTTEVKTSHSVQQQRSSAAKKSLKITHLETRGIKLLHLSCYKHCFVSQASSTELFQRCRWDLTDILSDIHWIVKNNRIGYFLHFLLLYFAANNSD